MHQECARAGSLSEFEKDDRRKFFILLHTAVFQLKGFDSFGFDSTCRMDRMARPPILQTFDFHMEPLKCNRVSRH